MKNSLSSCCPGIPGLEANVAHHTWLVLELQSERHASRGLASWNGNTRDVQRSIKHQHRCIGGQERHQLAVNVGVGLNLADGPTRAEGRG
jgi:hypothetical protein